MCQGLVVQGESVFHGGLVVDQIHSIGELLTFTGDTYFFGRPYVNADTAGFAVVRQGDTSVDVLFEREYLAQPVISASVSFDQTDETTSTYNNRLAVYFSENHAFAITHKSVHGFTILLNKTATENVSFNWIALAVKDVKTTVSSSSSPSVVEEVVPVVVSQPAPEPAIVPEVAPVVEAPAVEVIPPADPVVVPAPELVPEPAPAPVVEPIVEPVVEPVVVPAPAPAPEPAPTPAPDPVAPATP